MHQTEAHIRERAKSMRRALTLSEARIWSWLRAHRFGDLKWRRQHPIGEYVVDFYCHALKLVIEIDGNQHETPAVRDVDEIRTAVLRGYGIEIVRISNRLIATDALMAAQTIEWAVQRARERLQKR